MILASRIRTGGKGSIYDNCIKRSYRRQRKREGYVLGSWRRWSQHRCRGSHLHPKGEAAGALLSLFAQL